ncbi:MAG: sigma 54-interacting transcriptional regulator, partial [Thermodesulfobacteriota bacterium]
MYTRANEPGKSGSILGTEVIELRALYEIAQLIGSAHDIDTTLAGILEVLHEILRMERATLLLLDETGEKLQIRASYGLTEEEVRRGVYRLDEGVCGAVFRSRSPFVVPDIGSEPLFLNKTGARRLAKEQLSFIGVPVLVAGKPAGVLSVDRLFGLEISFQEDVRFLTVVATLIAQFLVLNMAIVKKEASLRQENRELREQLESRFSHRSIVGQSKVMQDVFSAVSKVAASNATVLLLGESGTGKELVARAIHQESPRCSMPFIKVNCASLPANLLESELLGHEKGAFTGAIAMKKGRFELADGGTLFLDEIGELPLELQAKLLRVLQERQFERLGGTRTITVNVRVVAATNRSLEEEVGRGNFRADLFYRLNVVPVTLPPLRNRREDIPLLLDHFLRDSNGRNGREVMFS